MNERTDWKTDEQSMNKSEKRLKEISLAIKSDKDKNCLQPLERFELSTPGLRDQCSNHWANEADTLAFKIGKTNKQRTKRERTVNRDNLTKKLRRMSGQEY